MFESILEKVRETTPLVHNITNYVTVNDVANVILACGGSPIMADDVAEVEDITSICNILVINVGTLNERTVQSMILAGKKANELGHPVILDPVGAGASKLRTATVFKLLEEVRFSVIRGNISEMKTVFEGSGTTMGVDASATDKVTTETLEEAILFAQQLSEKTGAVIAITGEIDLIATNSKTNIVHNGHPMMSKITGSGCMLTAIIGAYCGANPDRLLESTTAAVCAIGLSGELAYHKMLQSDGGTSTFRMHLIDYMSKMNSTKLSEGIKIESR